MSTRRERDLDQARRTASPLHLDLIDALASAEISRRDFLRRGAVLGVSGSVMAAVLAACSTPTELGQAASPTPERIASPVPAVEPTAPPRAAPPAATPRPAPTPEPTPGLVPGDVADLRVGVITGDINTGLDPLYMLDLGTYAVVSQSFEYLVGLGPDGFVGATGLATSWSPNADATQWTFSLRPGVRWHDNQPFTAADVVATVDRLVIAGATFGTIPEGATEALDDHTVVVNLDRPIGNLPVYLSIFNPQSLMTPEDYRDSTRLDERPNGTGPWQLVDHDSSRFTTVFQANPDYWGGRPGLDQITLIGYGTTAEFVSAFQAGEIDVVQTFDPVDGGSLLDDADVGVLSPPSANHRQVWFNTQLPTGGPLTDARVRQAVAHCVDRQRIVDEVWRGRAIIANDHAVHPSLPFFDDSAVPQRTRDIDRARTLLAEAGLESVDVTIDVGTVAYSEDLARVLMANCADAGIRLEIKITDNVDFYGEQWCPGASWGARPDTGGPTLPCGASAPMGIVDYGHRAIPEIFLDRALTTDADWNSANFASAAFDAGFADYEGAADVASQRRAISNLQQLLHEQTPVVIPAFFDYLAAHRASLQNVQATALGHLKLDRAFWV